MSSWLAALKEWNAKQGGRWRIPKKGSAEYEEVRAIMSKSAPAKKEAAPRTRRRRASSASVL